MTKVFCAVLAAGRFDGGCERWPPSRTIWSCRTASTPRSSTRAPAPARHVAVRDNGDVYLMTKQLGFGRPDPNKNPGHHRHARRQS